MAILKYLFAICLFTLTLNAFCQGYYFNGHGEKVFTDLSVASNTPDSVRVLDLSNQDLKILPKEVFLYQNITELYLDSNNLDVLPIDLFDLKDLWYLDISFNQINELPPEIGNLKNLVILEARNNNLTILPESLFKLKHLDEINFSYNRIKTIPSTFGKSSLESIYLAGNNITELPNEFKRKFSIGEFDLSNNHLTTLPSSFFDALKKGEIDALYLMNNDINDEEKHKLIEEFRSIFNIVSPEEEDYDHFMDIEW